ncbi:MAG: hypothetical protein WBD80_07475 [Xanthobacteraceae bacterium]
MAQRQAAVLIADEIFYNLQGKAILQGIYHSDLIIPTDPTLAPQLLFFFIIETDVSEPFHSLNVQVTLPGNPPVSNVVFVPPPQLITPHIQPGRTRFYFKHPLLILSPKLRPGKIEAKVIHETGEIPVSTQWIVLSPPTQ